MSDIKRAVLTTLESQKVDEKVVKKHCKTVRIRVPLPEPNEDKCPEVNYRDELANVKAKSQPKDKEVNNVPNGLHPFDDENDDDVRRIALQMEAKYGSGMSGSVKKRRKLRRDEFADIGAGYDESDSFIDNTDGYDELIPPNVTTFLGGFYINSGALEFKTDDNLEEEFSSSSDAESPKPKRKRVLETSDEEEGESDNSSQGQAQKNGDKPNISMQQAIKKKLFSTEKIQIKKKKLADQHKNTVKELLREKRTDTNSADMKDVAKENRKPMRLSSVDAAIDSVIGRVEDQQTLPQKIDTIVEEQRIIDTNKNDDPPPPPLELDLEPSNSDTTKTESVKLPENLPADILAIIESIKRAAREYKDGGKVKFFNDDINKMLLSLERKCKVLGRSSRVRVYEHLSPFVKCRKETLMKRAKNLVFEDESRKLKRTITNLKSQIDQLMPALITNYEKECQRVLQRKFSQEAATNEELKNLKAPRRRFPLHEEMKRMIRDIVSFKKRCLLYEGKQKNALEELLTEYLKRDIMVLWPEGWMSMTVLKKFCTYMAIKTPDPKSTILSNSETHSQKLPASSAINYSSGNTLTITPVNLADKIGQVGNTANNSSSKLDTIIKPLTREVLEKPQEAVVHTIVKPVDTKSSHKEKTNHLREERDNGVIVLNSKPKEDLMISKETPRQIVDLTDSTIKSSKVTEDHCQIVDLTDIPIKSSKVTEDNSHTFQLTRERVDKSSSKTDFETTLKTKFPGLSVTAANTHPQNDRDDVQKVMESLKALQKLSSPSKSEVSNPAVSVIAFNKNYSNSNSSQSSGVHSDRTNFSGALGFQDEFQKQFINSFNHKPPSSAPPSKPGYNRCS